MAVPAAYFESFLEIGPEVLVNGDQYLGRPGFWAAHMRDCVEDEDLIEAAFRDTEQTRFYYDAISDTAGWPYFTVEVPGAHFSIIYRNYEGDQGLDYLLSDASEEVTITLCRLEGAGSGPCLSWEELATLSADGVGVGTIAWARRLLLLLPVLGDVAAVEHSGLVADALRLVGADGETGDLATALVSEHTMWEPARWYTNADGIVVRDGEVSPRNPDSDHSLSLDELIRVSELLHPRV